MKIHGRIIDSSFLEGVTLERVPCSLCGGNKTKILSSRDAVGLKVCTAMCLDCGLIYINPRPAQKWYESFYSALGGKQHTYKESGYTQESKPIGWGFERARRHGQALAERLGKFMRPGLAIDVGSSEGGVLAGLRDILGITPIGIEAVSAEAQYATRLGIPTHAALIENIESLGLKLPPADNIVCVKSLNHFLDPAHFFSWAWKTLKPDGRLLLEVKNFRHQVRRAGRIGAGIQLDHPYMYLPETLVKFVERAGFEILKLDVDEGKAPAALITQRKLGLPTGHMRLAAAKAARRPFQAPFMAQSLAVRTLARDFSPLRLYSHYLLNYANVGRNVLNRLSLYALPKSG